LSVTGLVLNLVLPKLFMVLLLTQVLMLLLTKDEGRMTNRFRPWSSVFRQ